MSSGFVPEARSAFESVRAEIREGSSEFDFRYSLVEHLFTDALGWTRTEGEGHVAFEEERKDVLCYDDSEPPFPAVVCETKIPTHDLDLDDVGQLETYVKGVGSAKYAVLTNGHDFRLYEYRPEQRDITSIATIDVDAVATADAGNLIDDQRSALEKLAFLRRDRYVDVDDAEQFHNRYQEVPVEYRAGTDDDGYDLFLEAVTTALDELTEVMVRFFEDYDDRGENSYAGRFLETTFEDWEDWREFTGASGQAKQSFCRETAYVILNRALFARIAEDKEIVGRTQLSSRGMADALEEETDRPYLDALQDSYDQIDDHYGDLYELGIFDWWWVGQDKRGQFSSAEERRQATLEDDLDYALGRVLKRLNRFDFERVNRDILGHVYEDYLPKQERKELGEYYTPIEVVQFMLDTVDYRASENIGAKRVLDPACGSGTFLTEVTERIIQHFRRKYDATSIHQLDAEQARRILDRIQRSVHGIDINPFAVHITQINLLFRTIDLYDRVTEVDPSYSMDGFEIHCADTLTPTVRERRDGSTDIEGDQSSLQEFAAYNGRAQSFLEDRDAVDHLKDEAEFDIVVANPPYVRIQNLSDVKEQYSASYTSAIKNFDIYVPFIERGLDWLAADGQMTYICPDRLVNADYAEVARNNLTDEPLTHLIDFKETDVFDAPTPYPCIFSLDRTAEREENEVQCARFAEEREGALETLDELEEWKTPDGVTEYELFTYPQSRLVADNREHRPASWKPMPANEKRITEQIEGAADLRVEEVTDSVFQGLITGADKVFIGEISETVDEAHVVFQPKGSNKEDIANEAVVEKSILRRVLKGSEIARWRPDWQGRWIIFPYRVTEGDADLLSKKTLKEGYPETWEYFSGQESVLKGREGGKWKSVEQWWAFGRRQNIEKFEPDKIMLGVLRQQPSFIPDTDGEYYFVGGGTAGGYGLHLKDKYAKDEDALSYFTAILNSRVLEFYHKHISFIFNSKYYSYGRNFLEPHPLPLADETSREKIVGTVNEMKDIYDELADLSYRVSDIQNYVQDYDRPLEILDLAARVGLSDDDYRQDPIRTDEVETENGTSYRVVMKRGHHLAFDDEGVREFVHQLLTAQDRRLTRREVTEMTVPTRDDVVALVEEYRADRERIVELEERAGERQDELDDLIAYEVYGLDNEAVATIDGFLDTW
jgi:type I restriction-modification system DNA methylase subunit